MYVRERERVCVCVCVCVCGIRSLVVQAGPSCCVTFCFCWLLSFAFVFLSFLFVGCCCALGRVRWLVWVFYFLFFTCFVWYLGSIWSLSMHGQSESEQDVLNRLSGRRKTFPHQRQRSRKLTVLETFTFNSRQGFNSTADFILLDKTTLF